MNQREVGSDTETFALALRAALRQAPKVILVGEMRDVETIATALEAAETGHLVLSTLHTIDAAKTIDRIVGVFQGRGRPGPYAIRAVVPVDRDPAPRAQEDRRPHGGLEILRGTARTRDYILKGEKEGKLARRHARRNLDGMQTFDSELKRLIEAGAVDEETALSYATNGPNLKLKLSMEKESRPEDGPSNGSSGAPLRASEMDNLIER